MLISADDRLSRARTVLERRGLAMADLLTRPIATSWQRCLDAGLDPGRPPALTTLGAHAVQRAREAAGLLRRLALGEMETLYHQIAGTNFMIALAAPDGTLLDTLCDTTFSETARLSNIRPGTLWAEAQCGTNALGTAAETGQAVTVHGGEHFFTRFGGLTCSAVPILGPTGVLAGVLDASSDCRSRQEHTHALVSMAATQIENGLFRECHRNDMILAFHSRAEFLHTLSAGLLAVGQDGKTDGTVLGLNGRARFLLQGLPAVAGVPFDVLFRTGLASLMGEGRTQLEDRAGSTFAARLETLAQPRIVPVRPVPLPAAPSGFVAEDLALKDVLRQVQAAASRGLPILIRGETGTGKEHLARHAHQVSRRPGAFVPVNCAGLPDTLIEAEMFGHADGAFTGARRGGAPGLVAEADGGTLFLDEIGDMKMALQSVLLRLLDDWTLRPVGGGKQRRVNVLLVAATNVDLDQAVADGRFRADLLYRINTVDVTLPPLSARSDFGAIARRILAAVAPGATLLPDAERLLARRPWPGNARELRSFLTRLTLSEPDMVIDVAAIGATPVAAGRPTLRTSNTDQIRQTCAAAGGNIAETARILSVSRNTVYRALRNFGVSP